MESPRQRCVRLVAALEDIAAREAACVRNSDFDAVLQLQERAAPIVAELTAGVQHVDTALRDRISAVVKLRDESAARIQVKLDETRDRLTSIQDGQRRAAKVAPVYGKIQAPRPHLTARG